MDLTTEQGRRKLGRRIRSAITEAGYKSLPAFARALGCSRALIYQYVNADVLVQLDRLAEIAELTDRELTWFFTPNADGKTAHARQLEEQLQECEQRGQQLQDELSQQRQARLRQEQQHRTEQSQSARELALAYRQSGDWQDALQAAIQWRDMARALDDDSSAMAARVNIGHSAYELGDHDRAQQVLTEAVEEARRLDDTRHELSARQELVRVSHAAGDFAQAMANARQLADSELWWPQWAGCLAMAALYEQSGELESAEEQLDRARQVMEGSDERRERVETARVYWRANRANITLARGDYGRARIEAESVRDIAADADLRDQRLEGTLNLAVAELRTGRLQRAQRLLEYLQETADPAKDRSGRLAEVFEAELLLRRGHRAEARLAARKAMEGARQRRSGLVLAETELMSGRCYLAAGMGSDARYYLDRCLGRAESLRLSRLELSARLGLLRTDIGKNVDNVEDDGFMFTSLIQPRAKTGDCEELQQLRRDADDRGYADIEMEAALTLAAMGAGDGTMAIAERVEAKARETGYVWAEKVALGLMTAVCDDEESTRIEQLYERLEQLRSGQFSPLSDSGQTGEQLGRHGEHGEHGYQ